jgi:signal transduction histidine kinase
MDVTDRIREDQELRRRTEQLTAANDQLRRTNEQLRQTQAQLVHSEKLASLGTLAAGMAHEINNPLAVAFNNTAVLERDVGGVLELLASYREGRNAIAAADPEVAGRIGQLEEHWDVDYIQNHLVEVVRATRRALERVAKIVSDLRSFARLDRSQLSEMDPNESLEQALGLLAPHLARLNITVERDLQNVPLLECSAASVNQVLFQLLMNAVQAIEDGGKGSGRIRVATRAIEDEVEIEIADDGCGIAPEVLPRLFDPFFTTKPVGRGTGLGLSISHSIVAEHGGRIEVDGAVGQGSSFRVRFPLQRAATG